MRTSSVDICFDENVDAPYTVKGNLHILVVSPVAHARHVFASRIVLFVPCSSPRSVLVMVI